MCPGTLAIASAVTGAVGAIGAGNAQASAAKYNSQVASNNALIAKQNQTYSAGAASANTTEEGLKIRQQDSSVRAGLAANGIEANSGSATDVQAGQREVGQLDVDTVANRGAQTVYGYGTQASGYQSQATLDKAEAGNDEAAGFLQAGKSLLTPSVGNGVSSAFSWMTGNPTSSGGIDGDLDDDVNGGAR